MLNAVFRSWGLERSVRRCKNRCVMKHYLRGSHSVTAKGESGYGCASVCANYAHWRTECRSVAGWQSTFSVDSLFGGFANTIHLAHPPPATKRDFILFLLSQAPIGPGRNARTPKHQPDCWCQNTYFSGLTTFPFAVWLMVRRKTFVSPL